MREMLMQLKSQYKKVKENYIIYYIRHFYYLFYLNIYKSITLRHQPLKNVYVE